MIYNLFLLACCLYAWLFGRRPERIGAALAFGASMATWVALELFGNRHAGLETGIFVIDVLTLAGIMALALTVNRYWTLWAAGFHLVGVATHAAVLANATVAPIAYAHALGIWSYAVLISLVVGTWFEAHRARFVMRRA